MEKAATILSNPPQPGMDYFCNPQIFILIS